MKCDMLIIDGRHMLYRTSDAFSDLSTEIDGVDVPTGGIYGFLNVLLKIHARWGGKVVVAWEGKDNFRVVEYPQYKGKDKPIDPDKLEFIKEMFQQEHFLKLILRSAGVRQYEGVGCEADDVMGRLAYQVGERGGHKVIIYTGDSDLRQCVYPDRVWTVSPSKGKIKERMYGPDEVFEKDGVKPDDIPLLKALAGDGSDNIPGVRGIGPKTAAILVNHYGDLEDIIVAACRENEDWPVAKRFQLSVANVRKDLALFLRLTTIKVDCGMKAIETQKRQADVVQLLHAFKFRSLAGPAELHGLMKMGGV